MGITREMSKILSTSTAITTDAEISAYNYLSQGTASATYLNQTAYQPGLVLVRPTSVVNGTIGTNGTVTFSNAATVSLNGCFSSSYQDYKIIVSGLTSAETATLGVRLRSAGSDESSGSNFYKNHVQGVYATGTTFAYGSNGSTSWENVFYLLNTSDNGGGVAEFDLKNPFASVTTSGFMRCYAYQADTTTRTLRNGGMSHTAQSSYDGISLIPTTSNISGTIKVYGYRD